MGDNVFHLGMHLFMHQPPPHGFRHNGVGHRMGEMLLQAGGDPQHLVRIPSFKGDDAGDHRLCLCKRTRFVKNNGIRFRHRFQIAASFYGDLERAGLAHGRKHRQRHGEL